METVNKRVEKKQRPVRLVQFGEGNFLRGFVDYMVDVANEKGVFDGSVAIVKPIEAGNIEAFHDQDCVYTLILRGGTEKNPKVEKRIITSVDRVVDAYGEYEKFMELARLESLRFVVSNTTEAGIRYDETDSFELNPPKSYPGKLTKFLYERYKTFHGDANRGLILMPVELIEANGKNLRKCVLQLADLWKLEKGFTDWVKNSCVFCSTLVDRIVTGYPRDEVEALQKEFGYADRLIDTAEPFALWVIESDKPELVAKEFPMDKAGLPVIFTKDQTPYRERKVRILNGAHTSTVPGGFLAGFDYVGECMKDPVVRGFMEHAVFSEIVPTVHLPHDEVVAFANSVFERFENPFIHHSLLAITLNSVSKWKARVLPSLKDSLANTGKLPACLTFSFAALLTFDSSNRLEDGALVGDRNGKPYSIRDDASVLEFFRSSYGLPDAELAQKAAQNTDFWGEDLSKIPGFVDLVTKDLAQIHKYGMREAMRMVSTGEEGR